MRAIYLTGFMGAGKTTIGTVLGEKLSVPVIDTDHYIEEWKGKRIADIFGQEGEHAFRQYETEALLLLPKADAVIMTGGGLPLKEANREMMNAAGTIVYLHCDFEVIVKRLEEDQTRPLFNKHRKEEMRALYEARRPAYEQCHFTLDVSVLTPVEAADSIITGLNLKLVGKAD
ncbi:shikimate kinase [Fictibacillus sp. Mic-4]|uniref:shikimate kinase n=1 Tax=Fictibacillus TaxID=1329200 RepID=UPI0003FF6965|nr:shikimate kinase [Fictibacillus gelatini]